MLKKIISLLLITIATNNLEAMNFLEATTSCGKKFLSQEISWAQLLQYIENGCYGQKYAYKVKELRREYDIFTQEEEGNYIQELFNEVRFGQSYEPENFDNRVRWAIDNIYYDMTGKYIWDRRAKTFRRDSNYGTKGYSLQPRKAS